MKVESLQRVLQRLADLYRAGGATSEADDVKKVVEALTTHADKSVKEFVDETKKELKAPSASNKRDLDLDTFAQHSERLLNAAIDRNAFDQAFSLLDADKALSKLEIFSIANIYLNRPSGGSHVFKFDTAREAKARIKRVFAERLDVQRKNKSIEKLTGWDHAR